MKATTWALGLVSLLGVGCAGASGEAEPAAPAQPTAADSAEPSGDEAPANPTTGDGSEPSGEGNGRLAFVTCEEPRKQACTKEYRPVCGEVDTGVRCVTTPCPSSEKKTFGNACMACAESAVIGYFPQACAELGTEQAP